MGEFAYPSFLNRSMTTSSAMFGRTANGVCKTKRVMV